MADQFSVKILKGLENNLGEDDYIEPLNILVNSLNKNKLNFFGELAFKHQLKRRLKTRKFIYGEFKNNTLSRSCGPGICYRPASLWNNLFIQSALSRQDI